MNINRVVNTASAFIQGRELAKGVEGLETSKLMRSAMKDLPQVKEFSDSKISPKIANTAILLGVGLVGLSICLAFPQVVGLAIGVCAFKSLQKDKLENNDKNSSLTQHNTIPAKDKKESTHSINEFKGKNFIESTSPLDSKQLENKLVNLQERVNEELAKSAETRDFDKIKMLSKELLSLSEKLNPSGPTGIKLRESLDLCRDSIKNSYPKLKREQTIIHQDISKILEETRVELLRKGSIGQLNDYLSFMDSSFESLVSLINQHGDEGEAINLAESILGNVKSDSKESTSIGPSPNSEDYKATTDALMSKINWPHISEEPSLNTETNADIHKATTTKAFESSEGVKVSKSLIEKSRSFALKSLEIAQKPLDPAKPPPAIGKEAPHIFSVGDLISKKIYNEMDKSHPRILEAEAYKNILDESANQPTKPKNYDKISEALTFFSKINEN